MVYEQLIKLTNANEAKPIIEYLSGLGQLAKTDIHLRLEDSALVAFYQSFYQSILEFEKPNSETDVIENGYSQIEKMLTGREEFDRTIKLVKDLFSLREVIAMKHYCEIYFLTIAARKLYKDDSLRLIPMSESPFERGFV